MSTLECAIKRLERRIARLQLIHNRFANGRLALMVAGLGVTLAFYAADLPWWWGLVLTTLLFSGVVVIHRRYQQALAQHRVWRDIKREHLARLRLEWSQLPASTLNPDPQHPFELDLDLIQLHRLLNTASSQGGATRLHEWLTAQIPQQEVIQQRQTWIGTLKKMPLLRDKLTLHARLANEGIREEREGQVLLAWLKAEKPPDLQTPLLILTGLALLNAPLFALWAWGVIPPLFLLIWLPYAALYLYHRQTLASFSGKALSLSATLRKLVLVWSFLETYRFGDKTTIQKLCSPFIEARPSRRLRALEWIVGAASLQTNPYLWLPVNALLPWDMFWARRLSQQQSALAQALPRWLEAWFDLEALSALATFAALHPHYTFPVTVGAQQAESPSPLVGEGRGRIFRATRLGHPLLPEGAKVTNDVSLGQLGEVMLITGSNMAGKSSFLRTMGVNLALAYAGSVVDAAHLETGLFRLFTSMRITDSLDDGISYFYAEVKRLRRLLEALHQTDQLPIFFLIDEIFRGTNNRERLIGSRAYVQALSQGCGVGAIATHDLELTKLAEVNPNIKNYHFREEVQAGRMIFDYTLRQGACPTTNALTIMALEGLPVEL